MTKKAIILMLLLLFLLTACKPQNNKNGNSSIIDSSTLQSTVGEIVSSLNSTASSQTSSTSATISSKINTSSITQTSSKVDVGNINILTYFSDATFKAAFESALKIALPNKTTFTVSDVKNLNIKTISVKNAKGTTRVTLYNVIASENDLVLNKNSIAQGTDINSGMANVNCLSGLEKIEGVEKIYYTTSDGGVISSSMFSKLTSIKYLTIINGLSEKFNLSEFGKLTNLEYLSISPDFDGDFSFITSLKKLKELYLYGSNINDLTPVSKVTTLETLTLGSSHLEGKNLSLLKSLVNLKYLSLYRSYMDSANVLDEVIPQLQKLEKIKIGGCYSHSGSTYTQIDTQLKANILALNNKIVFES